MANPPVRKRTSAKPRTPRNPGNPAAREAEATLATRIREALLPRELPEKRMFTGRCFLLNGNMLCGTTKEGMILRVGAEARAECLRAPEAAEFIMQGKSLTSWVTVDAGLLDDADLQRWIGRAILHVGTLPAK